jgi:hypothetical protein
MPSPADLDEEDKALLSELFFLEEIRIAVFYRTGCFYTRMYMHHLFEMHFKHI